MPAFGHYDSALQMFVQAPGDPDLKRLSFLRWIVQSGRLADDGSIIGTSCGELAVAVATLAPALAPAPRHDMTGYD
jgi:hypothetical protein